MLLEHVHKIYQISSILVLIIISSIREISGTSNSKLIAFTSSGNKVIVSGEFCRDGIYFKEAQNIQCACVTGLWSFYTSWCIPPMLMIGSRENPHCFLVPEADGISHATLLAGPEETESLIIMSLNMETLRHKVTGDMELQVPGAKSSFINLGPSSWELVSKDGTRSFCLPPAVNKTTYCYFTGVGEKFLTSKIRKGCSHENSTQLDPDECLPSMRGNEAEKICAGAQDEFLNPNALDQTDETKILKKRDDTNVTSPADATNGTDPAPAPPPSGSAPAPGATDPGSSPPAAAPASPTDTSGGAPPASGAPAPSAAPPPAPAAPSSAAPSPSDNTASKAGPTGNSAKPVGGISNEESEDYIDPKQLAVKNNPLIMEQLRNRLLAQISQIVGARSDFRADKRYPMVQLLETATSIMANTCPIVKPEYFSMAFNAFVNIQLQTLHLKEPYLTHTIFRRIDKALKKCNARSTPYIFISESKKIEGGSNTTNGTDDCYEFSPEPGAHLVSHEGVFYNVTIPIDRLGGGFEPIIETVWKTLLAAHSYCYNDFLDYYNDHHTFTVALMPFFTNEIQDMWFPEKMKGTYVDPDAGLKVYGGLIGDHKELLRLIDLCYGASRLFSKYPWHLNRPPRDERNKWAKRRRRSTSSDSTDQNVCINDPSDYSKKVGLPEC